VLNGFEADLAVLFGAGFADPNYAAADGVEFIITGDDLDKLPRPKSRAAPEAKPLGRPIHDEAGNTLWVRTEINDDTGSFSQGNAFGAAAFSP